MAGKNPANSFFQYSETLTQFSDFLKSVEATVPFSGRLERTSLNESWFSDILAWLLDVNGSHGYGVAFATQFVRRIAMLRTNRDSSYTHRNSHLRFGRLKVAGTLWSQFHINNSAVFREFYLSNQKARSTDSGSGLCDLVFLDLDSKDGLFVAIENKLFSTNSKGQLEGYYNLVEEKFHRSRVREYVYLTLVGEPPFLHKGADTRICNKSWVRMSWIDDILEILADLPECENREVGQLCQILSWLKAMLQPDDPRAFLETIHPLFDALVSGATECVLAELQRLNEGAVGQWQIKRRSRKSLRIVHTSKPSIPLHVGILPNLSIVIQNRKDGYQGFEKVLIPFGSNPDQIFNLIDFAARDIYELHFGKSYRRYLGPKRRLTTTVVPVRRHYRDLFKFVHKNRKEIQLLLPVARKVGESGGLSCE